MTRDQHAQILRAYLARLSDSSIKAILAESEKCTNAQLNYGLNGQIAAQNRRDSAILTAINSIIDHDLQIISSVIGNATKGNEHENRSSNC